MANTSIGGLVSGLDTASIISQLMQLEARPQTMLKTRMGVEQKAITSLQSINAKLAAIATKAAELAKPASWAPVSATSSNDKVTVAVAAGAAPASLTFTVDRVATAAREVYSVGKTAADTTAMPATLKYQITYTDGRATEQFTTGTGSLTDIAAQVNKSAGVRATLIRSGGKDSAPTYDLHLTSTATGDDSGFTISQLQGPTDPVSPFLGGAPQEILGANALITPSGLPQQSFSSNTITGLMPGVDVTLQAGANGSATITVAQDSQSMTDKVKALVDAVNSVMDDIGKLAAYDATTKSSGSLAGDATLRDIKNQLLTTVTGGVAGKSLAPYGIQTDRSGKLVFDADKFKAAYQGDPAKTAAQFTMVGSGFAVSLEQVSKRFSDSIDGSLTNAITGRNASVTRMQKDIESWDVRLEQRKSSLERQYAALEVALGKLQSQSTWLAGQIGSLPKMSSGN